MRLEIVFVPVVTLAIALMIQARLFQRTRAPRALPRPLRRLFR